MTEQDHADPAHAGRLHHVEWVVGDYESCVDFYDWFLGRLGYEIKNEWEDGRSYERGPTYLVVKRAAADGAFDRDAPGLDHLAFHAPSRERVDELTAGVRERDEPTVLYPDRHPYAGGYYALYCEDPAGIVLEVVAPEV
ncbi:MAG: VOC family protein [Halobaculum sp.]